MFARIDMFKTQKYMVNSPLKTTLSPYIVVILGPFCLKDWSSAKLRGVLRFGGTATFCHPISTRGYRINGVIRVLPRLLWEAVPLSVGFLTRDGI